MSKTKTKTKTFYAVKRLSADPNPRRGGPGYYTISHIGEDGYFRGPAVFESKEDASAYVKICKDRLEAREMAKKKTRKAGRTITMPRFKIFEIGGIEIGHYD